MFEITGKYTSAKIMIDGVDETTMSQLYAMISHPAFTNPVAIMPDTHAGKGCVVGFTMPITDKVIPNIVGVDIGCGMLSFNVGKNLFGRISKKDLDDKIRQFVPFGTNTRSKVSQYKMDWTSINKKLNQLCLKFNEKFDNTVWPAVMDDKEFTLLCKRIGIDEGRALKSLGTLGGGNHFIEVSKSDNTGDYWITIHSGSRNFGKCVAEYWQKIACTPTRTKGEHAEFVKKTYDKSEWESEIKKYDEKYGSIQVKGMEYLSGAKMYRYLVDMMIAQEYSSLNRHIMMREITDILCREYVDYFLSESIETIHNFIDFDDWIIRKGSIRSYEGEKCIIPFNMRDGILLCEGKSNPEWNYSAPHGAGRVYSRSKAKAVLNIKDVEKQMEGIYTSCIPLDEASDAYKDPSIIEECIEPTVTIVDRLIPVMNLKCNG